MIVVLALVFHVSEEGSWKGKIKLMLLASSPHFNFMEAALVRAELLDSGPPQCHSFLCLPGPKPSL